MSLLLELLSQLGAGTQVMIAGGLALAAYYLFKGRRVAGAGAAIVGSTAVYGVVVLVALAVAIGLGWLDPNPGLIRDGVSAAVEPLKDLVVAAFKIAVDAVMGNP